MKIVLAVKAVLPMALLLIFTSCHKDDSLTASPSITDFSPTEGAEGTTVTINGINFSTVTSENVVKFNGTAATVTAATTTTLTTAVPAGATTDKITVEVGSQTATSANNFKVLAMPAITSFSPMEGTEGTTVTISGTNFSAVMSENAVKFNGTAANVTAATATALTVTAPAGATTGKITVQVGTQTAIASNDFAYMPTVSTLAGSGTAGFADGTGTTAQFNSPLGVAVDAAGNLYVADLKNNRIRKITPSGEVSTLAGSGIVGSVDGTGTTAQFNETCGVAVDASGNVYVADRSNHRIRKITPGGEVSTLAGSILGYANGTGTAAKFYNPRGVAVDASGNVYVADYSNHRIRKITPGGEVSTLAGSGTPGFADGTGTAAQFYYPASVVVDPSGNVYVADLANYRIRKITSSGEVSTLAGSILGYGTGTAAQFKTPIAVALDANGNVYVADSYGIRKITTAGEVSTLAGGDTGGYANGVATDAKFVRAAGVAVDASGNVYVADELDNRIRKITIQ